MTKDVGLKQGVSVKSRPLCGEVSLNLVDGIENILKTKSIAPLGRHRGTASLRTIFSNLPLTRLRQQHRLSSPEIRAVPSANRPGQAMFGRRQNEQSGRGPIGRCYRLAPPSQISVHRGRRSGGRYSESHRVFVATFPELISSYSLFSILSQVLRRQLPIPTRDSNPLPHPNSKAQYSSLAATHTPAHTPRSPKHPLPKVRWSYPPARSKSAPGLVWPSSAASR